MNSRYFLFFTTVLMFGCPAKPVPISPEPADASDASARETATAIAYDAAVPVDYAVLACKNLVFQKCREGCDGGACSSAQGDSCEHVLTHSDNVTDLNLPCVAGATNIDTIRSCAPAWKYACGGSGVLPSKVAP